MDPIEWIIILLLSPIVIAGGIVVGLFWLILKLIDLFSKKTPYHCIDCINFDQYDKAVGYCRYKDIVSVLHNQCEHFKLNQ